MMNSFRRNNSGRRRLVAATVLVAVLFFMDVISGGKVRALVRVAGSAVWKEGAAIGTSISHSGFFSSRAQLAGENAALADQVRELQGKAALADALTQENAQLRALTHLASQTPGITAPVLSSFASSPYGTFEIGAGSADGVPPGALVMTADGFAVGKIKDEQAHQSLVGEFFAPGASLDVLIAGVPATLQGQGGGSAHARIPLSGAVVSGAVATAPELSQRPVGVVGHVSTSEGSAYADVYVSLPVNADSFSFVYVETH